MNVRYEISDGINPTRTVEPYIGTDASVTWEKEDAPKMDFKKELKEITLIKDDFKHFNALEKSDDRCDLQVLNVVLECGFDELVIFTGEFTMSSGDWDLDKCTVKFKVSNKDPYKCIKDNDDEINVLDFPNPQTAQLGFEINVATYWCFVRPVQSCDPAFISSGMWELYKTDSVSRDDNTTHIDIYTRLELTCPCSYDPGSEWLLIESCSGGVHKFAKGYKSNDLNQIYMSYVGGGRYEITNNFNSISEIDNGRKLEQVMQRLLDTACPGLTLKSDFFQWNPDISTNINYVTNELNKLTNLLIFQKSDVKRANTSNNATKAMINFKDMVEQICNIFNLRYQIQGNDFRLEHLSYFERDFGIDLLQTKNAHLLKGTRQYSYDESKLPKYEKFEFMEAGSPDFVGVPIKYINNCVNNDEENRTTISADKITTDVMYAIENPDPDGDISDDGFVLIACDPANNIYFEDGILESSTTINNTLGWAHLHRDFWKHGRVFLNGQMNNQNTEFLSIVPAIKQKKFTAKLGCGEIKNFDPIDQIKGTLGWGFLNSAEFKLSKCTMSLELLLDSVQRSDVEEYFGDFDEDFSEDFD